MPPKQLALLPSAPALPEGFVYRPDFATPAEEAALAGTIAALPFKPFEFHGYLGKRRVVFYGTGYDFSAAALAPARPLPDFLLPLRDRAAGFAGVAPECFVHALVTEYAAGAQIGWHRDRKEFGVVVGISLLAACRFRFRRRKGNGWERAALEVAPRSAYLLAGPARTAWEHSIPPLPALRYSITFRTLARS